ncbi:MAG: quinone-dependent dihydroorotate dehydrogenase [Microbacteriaceae bacterium]|nr:quinone-dependent dihydroorotate dehydrogenase [Microbacteriaceae bacterium]
MYSFLYRNIISRIDAEKAHHLGAIVIKTLGGFRSLLRKPNKVLAKEVMGIKFPSPVGIAAGFDKNATMVRGLSALGFGFIEIGTVTAHAQPGNPKPRLFRLNDQRALVNRMGFNNEGAVNVAKRLTKLQKLRKAGVVIGGNLGKSKVTPIDEATRDYVTSAQLLAPLVDYLVINVSSPNTPGLRGLQELESLRPLVSAVQAISPAKPLMVKIAPDLDDDQVVGMVKLFRELGIAGVMATNTTIKHSYLESGGLSGSPLAPRSKEVLELIRKTDSEIAVISVGGVADATDVRDRLKAGADLVQLYTEFIFAGPLLPSRINKGLTQDIRRDEPGA